MKILAAEFLVSAMAPAQYPRQLLPEVAFAGRSNVGKSSLINTLLHPQRVSQNQCDTWENAGDQLFSD